MNETTKLKIKMMAIPIIKWLIARMIFEKKGVTLRAIVIKDSAMMVGRIPCFELSKSAELRSNPPTQIVIAMIKKIGSWRY